MPGTVKVENHFSTYKNKKEKEERLKQVYLILVRELNHKENIYYRAK